jgi:hypothetical protein
MRRAFVCKREEVTSDRRRAHSEEFHDLWC